MSITFVFAQFGNRQTVDPTFSSLLKYFSDEEFVVYTDNQNVKFPLKVKPIYVKSIYDLSDSRYGNRSNDFFKVVGLLESKSEYAIALDNDMLAVSKEFNTILPIIKRFGLCLPCNPRYLVRVDNSIGADSDSKFDDTLGNTYAVNMSPIGLYTNDIESRKILNNYEDEMRQRPIRGPTAMWRAIWRSNKNPYMLPPQWCVCQENCGIGNEIMLHVGHEKVKQYYGVKS